MKLLIEQELFYSGNIGNVKTKLVFPVWCGHKKETGIIFDSMSRFYICSVHDYIMLVVMDQS